MKYGKKIVSINFNIHLNVALENLFEGSRENDR